MASGSDPLACQVSFCNNCGTIIMYKDSDVLTCICCGTEVTYGDLDSRSLKIKTQCAKRTEPKWVRDQRTKLGLTSTSHGSNHAWDDNQDFEFKSKEQNRATVNETCPKCGHGKASFYTMQLRSVDEGQTVFYECLKCANNWSQNN